MSRFHVLAFDRLSPDARLRIGFAALSVSVALSLAALLSGLSLLRGTTPSSTMLIGIALGLCAELLCLDLALRRVRQRLGGIHGVANADRSRCPSAPAPAVR